ncbi:restriction endonuclease subunit S [Planctomycetota bacterium]
MVEWRTYPLKALGSVITGKTPSKNNPEDWGDAMPFVTPSDYKNYRKNASSSIRCLSQNGIQRLLNKVLPPKSVLVTCIGSDMGKVVMNDVAVISNQQINSIIPNKKNVDSNYLFYCLVEMYDILRVYGGDGTAVPIVNKGDFENMEITLPPLPEQKAIASILSSLDDKIDLLHRQNKTLEAMAETFFRQWFVEEAQEDWEVVKLDSLINISSGKGLKKEHLSENGAYPVLGANGEIGRSNEFLFDESLLFTGRVGTLGNIFRVENKKVWLSDNTLVIKPKIYFNFIYFVLKTAKLEEYNVGSTQPLIRQSDIKEIEINLPSEIKLCEFEKESDLLLNKIRLNKSHIHTLEKLRETLLPKLMRGEVRVEYEN